MKKSILRNIAIVSAVFIVTLSIMLITNYFQVRGVNPLQTEVIETLKEINDQNANNPVLQEQIRQLDLLSRKAYFISMEHLLSGVYILLAMLVIFIICTRLYFAKDKDIPDKMIDPIDEWAIKTKARKYIVWAATGIAAVALLFAILQQVDETGKRNTGEVSADGINEGDENGTNKVNQVSASIGITASAGASETGELITNEGTTDDVSSNVATGIAGDATSNVVSGVTGDVTPTETTGITGSAETTGTVGVTGSAGTTGTTGVTEGTGTTGTTGTAPAGTASQPVVSKVSHNAFRGNNSAGLSAAKNLPVKWDLKNGVNIAWRKEIPRKGYNSPVLNGNKIFFTGADEQARELFCYDLTTGEQLWSLVATNIPGSPAKLPETTEDTGLAAPTVATDGNKVCAIFATGDILCADMDGKQIWARNIGVPEINYGHTSSLLIFGNLVFVQFDQQKSGKIMALDITTGAERWSKNRTNKYGTWSSPLIANINNTPQLVLMGNPGVTAYNPNNGEQLWRVECMSGEVAASACYANGIVFAASEHAKMVAINATDGSVLWESNDFLPEVSSPVATKDNLYMGTVYGVVVSFDTQTGEVRKEHELNGTFYSSPIIAEGKVYLFNTDGVLYIFAANDEFSLLHSFETGENTFATPAFTDGRIVVRTEKSIYCVVNK